MSRVAIVFAFALAATAVNAQDSTSGRSQAPAIADENGVRPFLFDGRMHGDGVPKGVLADDRHPAIGTIVEPSKMRQPHRAR